MHDPLLQIFSSCGLVVVAENGAHAAHHHLPDGLRDGASILTTHEAALRSPDTLAILPTVEISRGVSVLAFPITPLSTQLGANRTEGGMHLPFSSQATMTRQRKAFLADIR